MDFTYPVQVVNKQAGDRAWAMSYNKTNKESFFEFVLDNRGWAQLASDDEGTVTYAVSEGKYTIKFGDVALLNHETHDFIGVLEESNFNKYWQVEYPQSPIVMPALQASPEPTKTDIKGVKSDFVIFDETLLDEYEFKLPPVIVGSEEFMKLFEFRKQVFELARKSTPKDAHFTTLVDNAVCLEDYFLTGDLVED